MSAWRERAGPAAPGPKPETVTSCDVTSFGFGRVTAVDNTVLVSSSHSRPSLDSSLSFVPARSVPPSPAHSPPESDGWLLSGVCVVRPHDMTFELDEGFVKDFLAGKWDHWS